MTACRRRGEIGQCFAAHAQERRKRTIARQRVLIDLIRSQSLQLPDRVHKLRNAPPPQCPMPGTMNIRTSPAASSRRPGFSAHAILKSHPSAAHASSRYLRLLFCGDPLSMGRASRPATFQRISCHRIQQLPAACRLESKNGMGTRPVALSRIFTGTPITCAFPCAMAARFPATGPWTTRAPIAICWPASGG